MAEQLSLSGQTGGRWFTCARCGLDKLTLRRMETHTEGPRCRAEQAAREMRRTWAAAGYVACEASSVVLFLRAAGFELPQVRDRWEHFVPQKSKGWDPRGRFWAPVGAVRVTAHGPPCERIGLYLENAADYPEAVEERKRAVEIAALIGIRALPNDPRKIEWRNGRLFLPNAPPAVVRRWRDMRRSLLADLVVDPAMCARVAEMSTAGFRELLVGWWDHTPRASGRGLAK